MVIGVLAALVLPWAALGFPGWGDVIAALAMVIRAASDVLL